MSPSKNVHWVTVFGWLNIIAAIVVLTIAMLAPMQLGGLKSGLFFTLGLQAAVSAGLIFTGQQLRAGSDLGHKAYPASLVAYGLFLLMATRWLAS